MHSDDKRYVLAVFAEGLLLQRLRYFREARELYLLLLASTKNIDIESLAVIRHTIGLCCIELGDFREADVNLQDAIELNRQMARPIEVAKIELGRGRLLNRRKAYAAAISHLRPVRREFLRHSMPEEAGLAGLEIVEAMLAPGKPSDAETLARTIVSEFAAAHLNGRAITALGYLSEAITSRRASAELATKVREYIVSLRTTPERDFHPGS